MNEVVSIILSEFYDNNSSQTITTTSTILKKLIRNATNNQDGASNQQQKDYTTIKLSNPKIQQHIVQVVGALDILGAVGFQQSTINSDNINASQVLKYTPPVSTSVGGNEAAVEERNSLIEAICTNLEIKISELNPPTTSSQPPPAWSHESTANSTAKLSSTDSTSPNSNEFLSNKERQERITKIKEQKKADRKARELAKQRWQEDSENRKLVQKRKELSMRNEKLVKNEKGEVVRAGEVLDVRVSSVNDGAGGGEGGGEGGGKKGSTILPKPFQTAASSLEDHDAQAKRRQLIQETMKDDTLSSKEKQVKIQLLMRGGANVGSSLSSSANAKVATSYANGDKKDTAASQDDTMGMMWKGDERKQPPEAAADASKQSHTVAAASMKQAPPTQPNDLNTARSKPTHPSKEWIQFIQQTPRCDSAENIRSTSVFYNKYTSSSSSAEDDLAVPNKCLKRLFKELDGLKNDLPSDPNCSIWLRFDEETPQYIRALITAPLPGPTPYSGGVFAFDIYIPNDYPNTNPKVQLLTTGGGRVRFGPNLYADGKVCLSLLGTWEGPKWNSKHSSLYQVLISIQGLILGVEHPYYLEPGHGGWEGTVKDGDFQSTGHTLSGQTVKQEIGVPLQVVLYEDVLRVGTVKHAIIEPIKSSLQRSTLSKMSSSTNNLDAFGNIIQAHFYENRQSILTEVRTWSDDNSLGRNRNSSKANAIGQQSASLLGQSLGSGGVFQIDQLQPLLPKLESLLSKVSMPKQSSSIDSSLEHAAAKPPPVLDSKMDEDKEDEMKPAAAKKPQVRNPYKKKPNIPLDPVEQRRQQMQQAAANSDFILAGKLQEEINRLEVLQKSMNEAATNGDFIRAGKLQVQFKALTEGAGHNHPKPAHKSSVTAAAWNNESSDDDDEDSSGSEDDDSSDDENEEMDWDEDGMGGPQFGGGGMGSMGGGIPSTHPGASGMVGMPMGLGKNVFAPPGYKQKHLPKTHPSKWGQGYTLASTSSAATTAPSVTTEEDSKMPADQTTKKSTIPLDQLCRLRIRLPQDKSVVEEFNKNDSLSEVYRRLDHLVPNQNKSKKKNTITGPSAQGGGAFSQPLSSAGFTLLLTRPKMEFSKEMHGTKSLDSLNLAPSATLTVMKCNERGIVYRGEVESRLNEAQGDAMDVEGLTYEGLMEITERVGKAGPKEGEAFLALTTEEYEEHTEKISPSSYFAELDSAMDEVGEEDGRCPICLGSYDKLEEDPLLRKVNNCGHTMHESCLQTWLATNSSCPLCKVGLVGKKKMSGY